MARGTELLKKTIVIAIGQIATQFVSFLLLPLYTTMLTTQEYGIVDLFTSYVQLLLPLVTLLIEHGAFRYLLDSNTEERKKRITTNSLFMIFVSCIAYSIIFFSLSKFIKNDYKYYICLILVVSSLSSWALQISRGFRNLKIYAVGSFLSAAIAIIFNILFVVVLGMGAEGMLTASIISNMGCFLYIFLKLNLYKYIKFSYKDKIILIELLKYSIPLIPNQISFWMINSSDRGIVNLFLGTAANGILAISHKFSSIYVMIFGMFHLSWIEIGTVHFNDTDRCEFFTDMFAQVYRFFSSICIGMIAIIPFVFPILIKKNFEQAYFTIPIYLIAVLCNTTVGLLGVVYIALKHTREIAKSTICSGVINIVVHILTIQYLGLYAAAVSTFISYFLVMIYRMKDTRRYIKIAYEYKIYGASVIIVIVGMIAYYWDNMLFRFINLGLVCIYTLVTNRKLLTSIIGQLKYIVNYKEP